MHLDLTIAIPVRNEHKNLPGCLAAIGKGFAQKIVVIDSASKDNTRDIALDFGAEVINFVWDGKFPKKRNWYLRNHTPDTKWILFLDADEYLTDAFKMELKNALLRDDKTGYWLRYTIYFLGEKLKGGYPLHKLALFKVGRGEYEKIDEDHWSNLDMEVHEHPILDGETGVFKNKIDHQDFSGISHYILKHNEYASWEAARFLKTSNDPEIVSKWTLKQRLKYRLMRSIWIGPAYFFGSFFLLGGFRDGSRGWAFAMLKMSYFNEVYCKIRETKNKSARNLSNN
jgi:glycosyltransferase involved in cell wall biosynthesis